MGLQAKLVTLQPDRWIGERIYLPNGNIAMITSVSDDQRVVRGWQENDQGKRIVFTADALVWDMLRRGLVVRSRPQPEAGEDACSK